VGGVIPAAVPQPDAAMATSRTLDEPVATRLTPSGTERDEFAVL
jgi:hypothetical protein